ncbi:MAG: ATP-binding protein, partial [Chloroflexota bacterium]
DARSHIKQHFINLVDVVIAAYQQEQDNFQASNIMFSLLPPPAPLLVPADAELLVTAITHILNNARQHTTADGTVNLLLTHDDGHANVRIEDNGAGMSEEIQTHMFQRFYRGSNRRQLRGFGLGLPIVQRIVELHDGTINIDSTVNAGTTVTIRLPRAVTNTLT